MGRKKIIKIPSSYLVKCPTCGKNNRIKVLNLQQSFQKFECKKCKNTISAPISQCCVLCAYSNKKCPNNLLIEANSKKLSVILNENLQIK